MTSRYIKLQRESATTYTAAFDVIQDFGFQKLKLPHTAIILEILGAFLNFNLHILHECVNLEQL